MAVELRKRDRNALMVAAAALVLFAAVQFLVFPMFDRRDVLKRRVEAAEKQLEEMALLRAEYLAISARSAESSQKSVHGKDFSLFSLMENYAGSSGIKDSIAYIKPSTVEKKGAAYKVARVEMKLEKIALNQLVSFLYQVETSDSGVNISRMSVSKTSKPEGLLDAVIQAETLVES
jgi:type II secretory pathway component PulM